MNLYAEICMVTTALFDAHAQAVRDETDARNDYARGMAAGQRVAYSHALKLVSQAMVDAVQAESPEPGGDLIDEHRRLKEQHAARYR
jgi:uncharacterized membrane protein